jgi:pseudouridine kinase
MNGIRFTVVGACNFDIYATSDNALVEADSNPGRVYTTPGGVGRNIAENLALLNEKTSMLTALGDDAFADAILKNANRSGLDLSQALRLPHCSTSVYVCLNKPDGDIALAVSDMESSLWITPAYLEAHAAQLEAAGLVVADANLTPETLNHLWRQYASKLCVDCVSTPKCTKVTAILKGLYCLKANRSEAEALTGITVKTAEDARCAASILHGQGVRFVIITLGSDGAVVSDGLTAPHMPLMPGETLNTSGCGDAFFAGALSALSRQKSAANVLRSGLAMARLCAASTAAVNPDVSPELLKETIQIYHGGAWQ